MSIVCPEWCCKIRDKPAGSHRNIVGKTGRICREFRTLAKIGVGVKSNGLFPNFPAAKERSASLCGAVGAADAGRISTNRD